MTQTRQGLRSTKPKPPNEESLPDITSKLPAVKPKEIYVVIEPIRKLYTYDTGRFCVCYRSGNHYIILACHVDTNAILLKLFQSRNDRHHIAAYDHIMARLKNGGHTIFLKILDNKYSQDYKLAIESNWNCKLQIVPPNVHRRNSATPLSGQSVPSKLTF